MKYFAKLGAGKDAREVECEVEAENGEIFVLVDGKRHRADLRHLDRAKSYSLLLDGRSFEFTVESTDEGLELAGGAGSFVIGVEDARTHAARSKTSGARGPKGPRVIKAVMPGIVRELCVAEGDAVEQGQPLLILEAMKMQNEIRADQAGTVLKLFASADQTVEKGEKLIEIE